MGRKPSRWANLPKGMRARPRGKLVHYYLDTGSKPRKEIPLGSDYVLAVKKWAELTYKKPAVAPGTFAQVLERYWADVIPTKAPLTQAGNEAEKVWLLKFFNDPPAPLDEIEPVHIRQYLDWRVKQARAAAEAKNEARRKEGKPPLPIHAKHGQVRANREKALFSHVWNYAREHGYTKAPNPCQGIKGYRESGRDTFVDDQLLALVMKHATQPLQFALRLAHITAQRPSDVLRMCDADISGGMLHVRQGKTKAKLRIVIEGELKNLLDELAQFKTTQTSQKKVRAPSLLVNEQGDKLTAAMLRNRFDAAGIDKARFQFRDLRAKAATETDDSGGTRAAQALLGHTTETMTTAYIRHKAGRKVTPHR